MFEWLLGTTCLYAPDGPGVAAPAPSGDGGDAAPASGGEAHPTSTKPDDGGGDDPDAFQFLDQEGAEEGDEPAKQEPAPQDTSSPKQEQPQKPEDGQPKPGEPQKPQAPQEGDQTKQPAAAEPAALEKQPADDGSPESVLKAFEEGREAIVEQLAEQRFSMTQEEVEAFQEDPGKFLPRFAAEAYLDAVRTSISYMQQIVPQLALRSVQLHSASSAAAESFFKDFSDLRAHAPQVEQIAKALRQTHPQMPQDEFQQRLGATARAALGLQPPQPVKGGNGQTTISPAPFQPASASAPAHQQVPAGSDNPWDSINEALLNPEEG